MTLPTVYTWALICSLIQKPCFIYDWKQNKKSLKKSYSFLVARPLPPAFIYFYLGTKIIQFDTENFLLSKKDRDKEKFKLLLYGPRSIRHQL